METTTLRIYFVGGHGTLTTDHAASSYGQPVLVVDGIAYGPADTQPGHSTPWGIASLSSRSDGRIELLSERPTLLRAWNDLCDASEVVRAASIFP